MGGWAALSRKYRYLGPLPEKSRRFRSLGMGYTSIFPVSYGNIVHLGVDDKAVFLRQVELTTKASAWQKIWMSKRLAEWFETGSGGAWTFSRI